MVSLAKADDEVFLQLLRDNGFGRIVVVHDYEGGRAKLNSIGLRPGLTVELSGEYVSSFLLYGGVKNLVTLAMLLG